MLKQLDTLIGFAVVMAVVSLLVTIATQIMSSLLALRGINLADALEAMIYKLAPDIDEGNRKALIHDVLTHPAISDSILSMGRSRKVVRKWKPAWWRFTARWKLASAMRPDELLALLQEHAGFRADGVEQWLDNFLKAVSQQTEESVQFLKAINPKFSELPDLAQKLAPLAKDAINSRTALNAAPNDDSLRATADQATAELLNVAAQIAPLRFTAIRLLLALHKPSPAAATALDAFEKALPKLAEIKGAAVVQEFVAAENIALNNLEKWFNSAQDRAQQWFAMHARIVTVIASFLAAFILQLDTIELFKEVSSDPNLRDKLVTIGLSTAFQAQASNIVSGEITGHVDGATHRDIVSALLSQPQYAGLPTNLAAQTNFPSAAAAEAWLASSITNSTLAESLTNDYQQSLSRKQLDSLGAAFQKLVQSSQQGGLLLLPQPYPDVLNKTWPNPHWYWFFSGQWSWPKHRLLGILFSAALLSLGAPFWFNLLKSLASLRPMLANEVDKDPKQLPSPAGKP